MDRFSFLGGVHADFIDDLYQKYLKNPDATEPSWRAFFQGYDFSQESYGDDDLGNTVSEDIIKEFYVINLINGYRIRGHLFTETNPVRTRRQYSPTLDIENYKLSVGDLDTVFKAALEAGADKPATLREIIAHLESFYCKSIGVEYAYIRQPERYNWIKNRIHINDNQPNFNIEQKKRILHKLNEAVAFENFLNTKFVGQKRFSIEGVESLIPALDFVIDHAAENGAEEFVVGMAHRGRLNVLTNIFGKPQREIFSEFEGKEFADDEFDGDVKYHLGYSTKTKTVSEKQIKINLSPNPSHLEAVDAVVEGITRAKINNDYNGNRDKVVPIVIHGDAAIAGQGIVYEVLQMEQLEGYGTGGTIHIVVNNQVGFTTNYLDARSSTYCTDVGKVVLAPVFHVNADDVEAVCHTMRIAAEYRQRFNRDVFVDLLGFRRYGHNEGDEPRFTQPLLYKAIARHPNARKIYSDKLMSQGLVETKMVKEMEKEFKDMLELNFDESKKIEKNFITPFMADEWTGFELAKRNELVNPFDTSVDLEELKKIGLVITTLPTDKKIFKKMQRLMEARQKMITQTNKLDWGMGELMAYGSLIQEGFNIRLSGEDVERGTFSHRHAIVMVEDSEEKVCLLNEIPGNQGRFAIYNSLLSEYGVLGFDYGYAMASPNTLVIWEAQFGDFANGAQTIIDQFVTAAEDKWKMQNGLVMLLPHGYEGQGAEHSSARLERFLQLSAQNNIQVCNATTPANFYHLLRRQMKRNFRKPLVVMSPKSLLRHPKAVSGLEELANGHFQTVLDDPSAKAKEINKVVFCSGKIYYDLEEEKQAQKNHDTAIIRLEQLYPLPEELILTVLAKYKNAEKFIWVQEEPANMGAWTFMLWKFPIRLTLISPPESAAPASGSHKTAIARHKKTVKKVFNI